MRTATKAIIALAMMLCTSTTWANTSSSNIYKDAANALTQRMQEKLNLDESQTSELGKLNLEYVKMGAKLRASDLGTGAKLILARQYHTQKKVELKQILSPEQYKSYEQSIERLKKLAKNRRQNW